MDATAAIAIYAALVATAALLVQYTQWRSSRTRLEIESHAGVAPILSEEEDNWGQKRPEHDEVLFIRLTNRSPHPVKVTHVGLIALGRTDEKALAFAQPFPLKKPLPIQIGARDNVTLWQPRKGLEAWEGKRVQAVIRTAAGDDFESPSFRFEDLPRFEIR